MFETRKLSKFGKKVLNTRKQKAFLVVRDSHTVKPSYWSEGSRTLTYALLLPDCALRGLSDVGLSCANSSPFDGRKDPTYGLVDNLGFIEVGTFCGKPATPTVIVKNAELVKDLFV